MLWGCGEKATYIILLFDHRNRITHISTLQRSIFFLLFTLLQWLANCFSFFSFCSCSCINTFLSWKNTFLPIHLTSWCFENLFFLFMLCREDLEGWSRYAVLSFTRCHLYFGAGSLFEQQVNRFISLDIYWPLRIILSTCLRLDISEHFTACYCARILSGCWSFLIRLLYLYSSYYMYWPPFLCLHLF